MKLTNQYNFPEPIVRAVAANPYDAGDADISITSLIDAPQVVELNRLHADDITVDVSDQIYSLLGQAMHTVLERANVRGTVEERLYIDCLGWRVSGQYDYIDEDGLLWDWKMVGVYEAMNGVKPEREKQLNSYAHMARQNGHDIKGLRIGFILRDWKQSESNKPNYPQHQSLVYPVTMWSDNETKEFIEERVRIHQAARGSNDLPECTEEERWKRPGKWAVVRGDNRRANRLFDRESDAVDYLDNKQWNDGRVDYRDGISVRCEHFCRVRDYCIQYQQHD